MLPIHAVLEPLKAALVAGNVAVLAAPPGAGKTTVVPLALLNEAWLGGGKILVLEPRRLAARAAAAAARAAQKPNAAPPRTRPAKIIGGSTITQQLAKNLFLSGERNLLRKGQELVLALMIEAVLDKDRILTIYLNSVEWGHGVFGAQAASQRYFKKSAAQLSRVEAARLAVMLPSPKFFETRTGSAYLSNRAGTTLARMPSVELP